MKNQIGFIDSSDTTYLLITYTQRTCVLRTHKERDAQMRCDSSRNDATKYTQEICLNSNQFIWLVFFVLLYYFSISFLFSAVLNNFR